MHVQLLVQAAHVANATVRQFAHRRASRRQIGSTMHRFEVSYGSCRIVVIGVGVAVAVAVAGAGAGAVVVVVVVAVVTLLLLNSSTVLVLVPAVVAVVGGLGRGIAAVAVAEVFGFYLREALWFHWSSWCF